MQAVRFGVNIQVSEEARTALIGRDGIEAQKKLGEFEKRIQEELGNYSDLDIAINSYDKIDVCLPGEHSVSKLTRGVHLKNTETGKDVFLNSFEAALVSGKPTDPDTGEKLAPQNRVVMWIAPWNTIAQTTDVVIQAAKEFIKKFNIQ